MVDQETLIMPHACLAGPGVGRDELLAALLRAKHRVTLVERLDELLERETLRGGDVLVLECSPNPQEALDLFLKLISKLPDLRVVLVDGDITQQQLAYALRNGAKDYFAAPYDRHLLVERIESMARCRFVPRR